MTRQEVLYKVIEIVNEFRLNDAPDATENSRLTGDLGMDSLEIVESAMDIQRRLGIRFDDDDWDRIKFSIMSVKDMVDLVCEKLENPTNGVQKTVEKPVVKPTQPQNSEIEKLKAVDLSKLAGKPVQLNGYEIVVKKIAETQQIKR